MKIIIKVIIFALCLPSISCQENYTKKTIYSDDKLNAITIFHTKNKSYIIYGEYKSDCIPKNDFIKNESELEYFGGLGKWIGNGVEIYSTYGSFESDESTGKITNKIVTTKRFEELKRDSLNYKYFYY